MYPDLITAVWRSDLACWEFMGGFLKRWAHWILCWVLQIPSLRNGFGRAALALAYQIRRAHSSYLDTVVAIQRARLGASACWRKQIEDF